MPDIAISSLSAGADAVGAELAADRSGSTVKLTPEQIVTSRLASTTPAEVGTAAVGAGTTAARADHVHAHGNQAGGSLHANATTSVAGFMSAADKTALDAAAPALRNIISETGTTRTLTSEPSGSIVGFTNGSAITVTVPTRTAGTEITLVQTNTGQITLSASGVTFVYDDATWATPPASAAEGCALTLIWLASTTVIVVGELEAA